MISPKVLLEISLTSYSFGIINTTENRFLSLISNKIVLEDLLSTQEERKMNSILSKIVLHPNLPSLNKSLDSNSIQELKDYIENTGIINPNFIIEKEVETGLLGVVLEDLTDVSITQTEFDGSAFFQVKKIGGAVNIILNSDHILCHKIQKIKTKSPEAYDLILSIIASWGIVEKEVYSNNTSKIFTDLREDWGRELRERLRKYE